MGCTSNGSFISWISSDSFTSAAVCLRTMFRRVHTSCRVLILADDDQLSSASLTTLRHAYGSGLLLISELARPPAGRRTYTDIRQTVRKFWLWKLDPVAYPLLFYVDLDVLVAQNLDDVFRFRLTTNLAATPCGNATSDNAATRRMAGFNAGVLLLRPDAKVFELLLQRSRFVNFPWYGIVPRAKEVIWPPNGSNKQQWYDVCAPQEVVADGNGTRLAVHIQSLGLPIALNASESSEWLLRQCRSAFNGGIYGWLEKVCAPKVGDQALHNHVLGKSWTRLPTNLNVDARKMTGSSLTSARLVHFLGEPKPWSENARHSRNVAVRGYRAICSIR